MNFETLKANFRQYLEDNTKPWNKTKLKDIQNDNTSIFMYADEFKQYLVKELNCDTSILTKGMDEIMKFQMVNGELVDPNEVDPNDAEAMAEIQNAQSLNEAQVATEKPVDEAAAAEGAEGEAAPVEGEEAGMLNVDGVQNYADENGVDVESPEIVVGILNDLLKDDEFKSALDFSQDGAVSDDELKQFLDAIKSYDTDEKSLSLEDVLSAVEDIANGTFRMKTDEQIEEQIGETPQADAVGLTKKSGSTANSSFNPPSSYAGGSLASMPKYDENGKAILDNMTQDELKKELTSAQSELGTKQEALTQAQDGSDPALQNLKEQENNAYDAYQEQVALVDEEMAAQLDEAKAKVDEAQANLDAKDVEISNQQNVVSSAEANVASSESSVSSLESQLSSVKSNNKDGSANDAVASLESAVKAAQAQLEEAKATLEAEKEKLTALEEEKAQLQEILNEANEAMTAIEEQIAAAYPQVQEYQQAYDDAKATYTEQKTEMTSTAQTEVTDAQNYVNEINQKISEAETKETIKEAGPTNNQSLVDLATQLEGMSETQVEQWFMQNYGGNVNFPDGLWCAAFVEKVAESVYGKENLPDWYTNCNFRSCSEVLAAANNNGAAFKDGNQAQAGDMIIFNTSRGQARHIGYVVSVENGVVTTIEGNSSNKVSYRTYDINDTGRINSYVRLDV